MLHTNRIIMLLFICIYLVNTKSIAMYVSNHLTFLYCKHTYSYSLHCKQINWDKQEKIKELNAYLLEAYGEDAPIYFTLEGISHKDNKSILWEEVKTMILDKNKNEVYILTHSNRDIHFSFTEDQYNSIASIHVHVLAYLDKLKE